MHKLDCALCIICTHFICVHVHLHTRKLNALERIRHNHVYTHNTNYSFKHYGKQHSPTITDRTYVNTDQHILKVWCKHAIMFRKYTLVSQGRMPLLGYTCCFVPCELVSWYRHLICKHDQLLCTFNVEQMMCIIWGERKGKKRSLSLSLSLFSLSLALFSLSLALHTPVMGCVANLCITH